LKGILKVAAMHHPFAFSVSTAGPELRECEIFAWIVFGISLTVVAIFVCCSWLFFHNLKVTIPGFCLLVFHPRVWLNAYHGDGGTTLRVGSILFLAIITIYAFAVLIFLFRSRRPLSY
jgi:hypothetical protein